MTSFYLRYSYQHVVWYACQCMPLAEANACPNTVQDQELLGFLEEYFTSSADSFVYGNGQESGDSPPVCVMISSVMLDEMDISDFKIEFNDPTQSINHDKVMIVYVDDSGAIVINVSTR